MNISPFLWLALAVAGLGWEFVERWRARSGRGLIEARIGRVFTPTTLSNSDYSTEDSVREQIWPQKLAILSAPLCWTIAALLISSKFAPHEFVPSEFALWAWTLGLSWGVLATVLTPNSKVTAGLGALAAAFSFAHFAAGGTELLLGTGAGLLWAREDEENDETTSTLLVVAAIFAALAWTRWERTDDALWNLGSALAFGALLLTTISASFARQKWAPALLFTLLGAAGFLALDWKAAALVWTGGALFGAALVWHARTANETPDDELNFAERWAWPLGAALALAFGANFFLRGFGATLAALAAVSVVAAFDTRWKNEAITVAAFGAALGVFRLLEARFAGGLSKFAGEFATDFAGEAVVGIEFLIVWGALAALLVPLGASRWNSRATTLGVWLAWSVLLALQGLKIVIGVALGAILALIFTSPNARRAAWSGLLLLGALAPVFVELSNTPRAPRLAVLAAIAAIGFLSAFLFRWRSSVRQPQRNSR